MLAARGLCCPEWGVESRGAKECVGEEYQQVLSVMRSRGRGREEARRDRAEE